MCAHEKSLSIHIIILKGFPCITEANGEKNQIAKNIKMGAANSLTL